MVKSIETGSCLKNAYKLILNSQHALFLLMNVNSEIIVCI